MEKTLVLIKPDGIERKLIGDIISFYERKNLNIIALKMLKADREIAEKHYEEHKGKEYFNSLIDYITEDKLCALVIEGENVIEAVRRINGDKDPIKADIGSIRGKFSCHKTRNLVHASDSIENANREISIWFPEL
ncbi:nucleoside-diphosphate kinase [Clostridium sp. SYSU_GA19001]|uniref:nucleoside-diphosphate kinase n=1 Tax=Clostridium caldaquaticum TaxID=2940653 RepID=UPI00207723FD|nr:nucleoside-diphosphate kinase [Clostridium caldaquaticum]MCM8711324.1 nucleoside-diphosphate kinase [Clostridium caldaquaticum]